MGVIRVFAGVPLPAETRMALADCIGDLDIPGKLAPPENWHLTLRFLGKVDQVTLERFLAGFQAVEAESSFPISVNRFGAFPRAKRATVVWVGIDRGESELSILNEIAEDAAVAAGLESEDRPFHPHITLSRVRPPDDVRWLETEQADLRWRCDRVVVYESHLGGGPARYEPLETFHLS